MAEIDTRPTQAEVEAQAVKMFGEGWKNPYEREKQWADSRIATKLDEARAVVIAARRGC